MSAPPPAATLAELEERLAKDLRPVRSFHPDRACAMVVAIGFGIGLAVLWPWFGLRQDAAELGTVWLWGPSALSVAIGTVLISLALRRVVPGNLPPSPALATSAVVGPILCALLYLAVSGRSSVSMPPPEVAWRIQLLCFAVEICLGTPIVLLLFWVARRGIVVNPLPAAIVGAIGVTLVSDAVWRLICPYSHPLHVAVSHGPGMIAVVLIGIALACFWDRRRLG